MTLLQHAPLCLEARCKRIEDKYEVKIDPSTLWNYYHKAKIRFRQPLRYMDTALSEVSITVFI